MNIMDYIRPELLTLIPFLWCIGFFVKRSPKVKNWSIPPVLLGISVIFTPIYLAVVVDTTASAGMIVVIGIVQGVMIAATAVGLYENGKNILNNMIKKDN